MQAIVTIVRHPSLSTARRLDLGMMKNTDTVLIWGKEETLFSYRLFNKRTKTYDRPEKVWGVDKAAARAEIERDYRENTPSGLGFYKWSDHKVCWIS